MILCFLSVAQVCWAKKTGRGEFALRAVASGGHVKREESGSSGFRSEESSEDFGSEKSSNSDLGNEECSCDSGNEEVSSEEGSGDLVNEDNSDKSYERRRDRYMYGDRKMGKRAED